jgi:hypothetical protein
MKTDIEAVKRQLEAMKSGNSGSSFGTVPRFKPNEDEEYRIRLLPLPNGLPHAEYALHYNVGRSMVCRKRQFGEECPVCELASRLWATEGMQEQAKKLFAKERWFSLILVRGEEEKGPQLASWPHGVATDILVKTVDEEWGDPCDMEEGYDWKLLKSKSGEKVKYASVNLSPSPRRGPVLPTKAEIKELAKFLKDFDMDGEQPILTAEEVEEALNRYTNVSLDADLIAEDMSEGEGARASMDSLESVFNSLSE